MNKEESKKIVKEVILYSLEKPVELNDDSRLVGTGALLDSMKLVEICIGLEDKADDHGFEFNWTSSATMSKSKSIFRNIESLSEEFSRQSELQK